MLNLSPNLNRKEFDVIAVDIKNYKINLLLFSLFLHTKCVHTKELTSKSKLTLWSKWTVFKSTRKISSFVYAKLYKLPVYKSILSYQAYYILMWKHKKNTSIVYRLKNIAGCLRISRDRHKLHLLQLVIIIISFIIPAV